jgi:FkbM family methyltransferase
MPFFEKIHTIIDVISTPRFFIDYKPGIIPTTYCRLSADWLKAYRFENILDIGANIGRFSITAHAVYPNARVIAFEPLPSCFQSVVNVAKHIPKCVALNIALGVAEGEVEMFENEFSPSSSILTLSETHKAAFPFAQKGKSVPIKMRTLDSVAHEMQIIGPTMIKIDVQGFEKNVIMGGLETIKNADVLLVELSYEELYEKQPLFEDINSQLVSMGFHFKGTMSQMAHPSNGRLIDADCFFVKG